MRTVLISLAAVAVATASPAFAAADAGPYVGVAVTHDNIATTGDAEGLGTNGVGGSAFLGYNLPVGSNVFAGIEGNFDLSSAAIGDDIKADYAYGVSGRLGFRPADNVALYGRVGYQRGRVTTDNNQPTEEHSSADGLRLGAGVEANVSGNVAVRVEYNHTHYYLDTPAGVNAGLANNQAAVGVVFGF
jgi:outer membrane immunogenic protein